MKKLLSMAVLTTSSLLITGGAFATNGKVSNGLGIKDSGMGGATVALPLDSISTAINPASIAYLDDRVDGGLTVFSPRRWYSASNGAGSPYFSVAPGTQHSTRNYFYVPDFGISHRFGPDNKGAIGLSVYGYGGMNSDYKTDDMGAFGPGVYSAGNTGVDLSQAFANLALAWNVSDRIALGGSLIVAGQSFKAKGLSNFSSYSDSPDDLTNNRHDMSYGVGYRLGILLKPFTDVTIGASYQPEIRMGRLHDYQGLFADHGRLNIEPQSEVGVAWHVIQPLTLTADAQYIGYDHVGAIANANSCTGSNVCLGTSGGAGFGWNRMWVYKVGAQYQATETTTLRAGYSHGKQPIPSSQVLFNILAPAVVEDHYSVGLTQDFGKGWEGNGYFQYVPKHSLTGPNQFDPSQTITLSMRQYIFGIGVSKKFA